MVAEAQDITELLELQPREAQLNLSMPQLTVVAEELMEKLVDRVL
jgi:hypothetical protein